MSLEKAGSVFGTVYSRNLTPDRETGLGAWSDAEIVRAITSGMARDGRKKNLPPNISFSHSVPTKVAKEGKAICLLDAAAGAVKIASSVESKFAPETTSA